MQHWLDALATLTAPAVLVTVATVEGSGPREAGAKMVVTIDAQFDTIGGGHLELRAGEIAREMLAAFGSAAPDAALAAQRRLERFALGPALGQCCGGVVHLAFERIDALAAVEYVGCVAARWRRRQDTWRLIALDSCVPPTLCDELGACLSGSPSSLALRFDGARFCYLMRDVAGQRWLVDCCRAYRPQLFLFGAGHVGTALVRALADLPCNVTWIDERDDMFPAELPTNVQSEATDTPQTLVDTAPAGASYLVVTHSHALDQSLSEHILRRADVAWFGLIGSKTKRLQFEHRLRARGIAAARLAAMVCPIGLPGIDGKAPAVIAASVCAQLLQAWEEIEQAGQRDFAYTSLHLPRRTAG